MPGSTLNRSFTQKLHPGQDWHILKEDPASHMIRTESFKSLILTRKSTMVKAIKAILVLLSLLSHAVVGGPLAYGICQTGCNFFAGACYASAGLVFGTVTAGAGTPAAVLASNAAQGLCMASCIAAGYAPTP